MILAKLLNEIDALVGEAKFELVQSRVYRQEAQVHDDLDVLYGPSHLPHGMGDACRRLASQYRGKAKRSLKEVEILNSQLYLRGGVPKALNEKLDGSAFRTWTVYQAVYKASSLFKGVDPA